MSTAGRYPESDYKSDAKLPLDGVRVLDLSRLVAGNMVTHVLADYGAEVIKIERPGFGDDLRNWRTEGVATHWKVYCRNKKSITLDLRKPEGKALFLKLVETADAVVENFKPGTLEDWGLGPDVLQGLNPKLGPDRPLEAQAGLRFAGGSNERVCGVERFRRPPARAAASGPGGHDRRSLWRLLGHGGVAQR